MAVRADVTARTLPVRCVRVRGRERFLAAESATGQPVPLTIWAPLASGGVLPAGMFAELVRQPLRYYEAALGVRYPYPKCDLVFVPAYPALAFSAPGSSA